MSHGFKGIYIVQCTLSGRNESFRAAVCARDGRCVISGVVNQTKGTVFINIIFMS